MNLKTPIYTYLIGFKNALKLNGIAFEIHLIYDFVIIGKSS